MVRIHALLLGALVVVGCAESTQQTVDTPETPTTVTAGKIPGDDASATPETGDQPAVSPEGAPVDTSHAEGIEERIKDAGSAVADWTADTRDKLVEQADKRLAQAKEEMDRFSVKAEQLDEAAKGRFAEHRKVLDEKFQQFSAQVAKLKEAGDEKWSAFSTDLSKSWHELQEAIKAAAADFG